MGFIQSLIMFLFMRKIRYSDKILYAKIRHGLKGCF